MRVVFLNYAKVPKTGGQKYNNLLQALLRKNYDIDIFTTPRCADLYRSWRKIYAPFAELRWLKEINNDSIVFVGDTCFRYHFLLLLILRLFTNVCPVVIIHHFPYLNNSGVVRIVNYVWQYFFYNMCKYIIVPSPYTFDIAKKHFGHKELFYLPIPFETKYDSTDEYEKGKLLFVGSVNERKGIHYLLESLVEVKKEIPFVYLDIVGNISDKDYYIELIKYIKAQHLEDSICFRGRVSETELSQLYRNAEIFVFPSLLEGYGMVLIEAMSHGLPIIAFNNSAIPYTIKDGYNGLLALNKNSQSLAERIVTLTGNLFLREKLKAGMKDTINRVTTSNDFEESVIKTFDVIIHSA